MPRYKLTIEYDGAPFVGWQIQDNGISVQGRLKQAIADFSGEEVCPSGAGRTDAGVHARGQVAHIDLLKDWDSFRISEALNFHLKPDPIAVLDVEAVGDDFDARFSALSRHYCYRIINRRPRLAIDRGKAWQVARKLDKEAMQTAAKYLVGKHDFTTFRSSHCQARSPIKTLDEVGFEVPDGRADREILISFSARSFMHNQVRSMVGSLVEVGRGRWQVEDLKAALEAKDRARCGEVAPASGLTLMRVEY